MRMLVLGTGRMARDLGLRFLAAGLDVAWASRDAGRLAAWESRARREVRRLQAEGVALGQASFLLAGAGDGPPFDALLESVEEDLAAKQAALAAWRPRLAPEALVLTNSSSLLPSEVGPDVTGFHGFYPSVLTGFCEVVLPPGCPAHRRRSVVALAARAGLRPLVQDEGRAFAVNRLLMPTQDWALRQVLEGADPAAVDAAFASAWPGFEPLAMMDAIGLGTVAAAVARYRGRMDPAAAADFGRLQDTLAGLAAAGRGGGRDAAGLRRGGPLPFGGEGLPDPGLAGDAEALFRNACLRALERQDLDPAGLGLAIVGLFGVQYGAPGVEGMTALQRERCEARFAATGLGYWQPPRGPASEPDPASGDGA